ncbi:hypothetical protein VWZ58_01050 [Phaeobacter sp. JH20_27]
MLELDCHEMTESETVWNAQVFDCKPHSTRIAWERDGLAEA